jgi:hypothetical protein
MFEIPFLVVDALLLGGLLPLLLTIVFVIVSILLVSAEAIGASYVLLSAYCIALSIFTTIDPISYVFHNPGTSLQFLVGYLIVGAVYTAPKFRSYIIKYINKVQLLKLQFIKKNKLEIKVTDEIPTDFVDSWKQYLNDSDWALYHKVTEGLKASQNKALILDWIVFWPFSAVGLLIADPIRKFINVLYDMMSSIYQRIYVQLVTSRINIKDINF